jgi:hypothetical protein
LCGVFLEDGKKGEHYHIYPTYECMNGKLFPVLHYRLPFKDLKVDDSFMSTSGFGKSYLIDVSLLTQ